MRYFLFTIALALSFSASAASITFNVVSPTHDVNGLTVTDNDIAFFTIKCGDASGGYHPGAPWTNQIGRDTNQVLQKSITVIINNTETINRIYCVATATGQYIDENVAAVLRAESVNSAEINFDPNNASTPPVPVPGALLPPGQLSVEITFQPSSITTVR